jgi:hypothetical protein
MTETITIRLRRRKSELKANAKTNLNAWINDLIEQALGPKRVDWNEHFESMANDKPVDHYICDEMRKRNR